MWCAPCCLFSLSSIGWCCFSLILFGWCCLPPSFRWCCSLPPLWVVLLGVVLRSYPSLFFCFVSGEWNETGVTTYKVKAEKKRQRSIKRLYRPPCKTVSTGHLSSRRLTANAFFRKSCQRGRAKMMQPSSRDINSIVCKLELYVLFSVCGHHGAITSVEHSTVVQEDILHHVNDMAGGLRGEITTGHP